VINKVLLPDIVFLLVGEATEADNQGPHVEHSDLCPRIETMRALAICPHHHLANRKGIPPLSHSTLANPIDHRPMEQPVPGHTYQCTRTLPYLTSPPFALGPCTPLALRILDRVLSPCCTHGMSLSALVRFGGSSQLALQ